VLQGILVMNRSDYPGAAWRSALAALCAAFSGLALAQAPAAPLDAVDIGGTLYVMTTAAHSNFAARSYYDVVQPGDDRHKNNHGVDFALSVDGSATGSLETVDAPVHAICDGTVTGLRKASVPVSHVVMTVLHTHCGPQNLSFKAYYGHMNATVKVGRTVLRGQQIGTVRLWDEAPGPTFSHLHISLDSDTSRDIAGKLWYACDYTMDAQQAITSVANCVASSRSLNPGPGQVRLRMGVQRIWADAYRDAAGVFHRGELYMAEAAVRQMGFVPFFDLVQ
jgi:murein DD-endopeptidase MepM/ murein hydrolase activator NlpD